LGWCTAAAAAGGGAGMLDGLLEAEEDG
jgi:hypothetical protein